MSGYYRMARGWMNNPALQDDRYSRAQAWIWMIEAAAFKEMPVGVLGRTLKLQRGQLCHSTRFMATAWRWPETTVRRFLDRLEADGMISRPRQTRAGVPLNATCIKTGAPGGALVDAPSGAGQTLITVCNYDKYQAAIDNGGALVDAPSGAGNGAEAAQERRK